MKRNYTLFVRSRATRRYYNLLEKALRRRYRPVYSERHHVIPVSLGGDRGRSNVVRLTGKQHYLAHKLLASGMCRSKIHHQKMNLAFRMMVVDSKASYRGYTPSAKEFALARIAFRDAYAGIEMSLDKKRELSRIMKRKHKEDPAWSRRISEATRLAMKRDDVRAKIIGPKTDRHRRALTKAALTARKKKIKCSKCGRQVCKQMYVRWHVNTNCLQSVQRQRGRTA